VRDQAKLDPLIDARLKGLAAEADRRHLRAVLRAGSYELEHRRMCRRAWWSRISSGMSRMPLSMVTKTGMVNAVLDQIARQFRADEFLHVGR